MDFETKKKQKIIDLFVITSDTSLVYILSFLFVIIITHPEIPFILQKNA